ncbi:hypothetical protein DV737_g2544, partial [Chaetothyriales sp. CBS 132003]
MPPMPQGVQRHGPSWVEKPVGSIMGFIYGTVTIFQYGAGQAGVMRTLGKYMLASGGMFGLFMGVGSLIRSDSAPAAAHMAPELWLRAQSSPILVQARRRRDAAER